MTPEEVCQRVERDLRGSAVNRHGRDFGPFVLPVPRKIWPGGEKMEHAWVVIEYPDDNRVLYIESEDFFTVYYGEDYAGVIQNNLRDLLHYI